MTRQAPMRQHMPQQVFLETLRHGLGDMSAGEREEILADYQAYFNEALAEGREIDDVLAAHGDPERLAQELRAEMGLRRWEQHHSPANFWKAALALCGLAAADIVILLPVLLGLGAGALILFFLLSLFGLIGLGTLLGLLSGRADPSEGTMLYLLARSLVFLLLSIGGGWVLLAALQRTLGYLARYARLHYRLLQPGILRPSRTRSGDALEASS